MTPLQKYAMKRYLLTKLAKPRWAKQFMSLSPEAQRKVMAVVQPSMRTAREIRPVGQGGERIADLVVHRRHGLAVRKVPLLQSTDPGHVKSVMSARSEQVAMEQKLREIAKGKGQFSHILDPKGAKLEPGHRRYYQFIPGKMRDASTLAAFDKADARAKILDKEFDRLRAAHDAGGPAPGLALRAEMAAVGREMGRLGAALQKRAPLDPGSEKVIAKLRKSYPNLHDIRGMNIVGGHVVDMSPRMQFTVMGGPATRVPRLRQAAHSKRVAFADSPSSRDLRKKVDRKKADRAFAEATAAADLQKRLRRHKFGAPPSAAEQPAAGRRYLAGVVTGTSAALGTLGVGTAAGVAGFRALRRRAARKRSVRGRAAAWARRHKKPLAFTGGAAATAAGLNALYQRRGQGVSPHRNTLLSSPSIR
jgi:hypothetical protein